MLFEVTLMCFCPLMNGLVGQLVDGLSWVPTSCPPSPLPTSFGLYGVLCGQKSLQFPRAMGGCWGFLGGQEDPWRYQRLLQETCTWNGVGVPGPPSPLALC